MKEIERLKTQKIIDKILIGSFDENDVDNLFMRLRAYSNGFKVFREIADFVAHNDTRDRGLTAQSLEGMYLSIKYFLEFNSNSKKLDIAQPFPIWIKKLMIYQIEKADEVKLNEQYLVSRERLKTRVNKGFKENQNGNCVLQKEKISHLTIQAICFVMSFISVKTAYSQDELIKETIEVINKNDLKINTTEFQLQANFFTLCTLLLLHNSKFKFKGYKEGFCKISPEKDSISYNAQLVDRDGKEIEIVESYGNLQVMGHVILENDGKDLIIAHAIMSTNLEVEKYCAPSLFSIEPIDKNVSNHLIRRLIISDNIHISKNRQLSN